MDVIAVTKVIRFDESIGIRIFLISIITNDNYNENDSIMLFYLQEYENQILECIYSFCIENGYIINNNCVSCNDGIMIEKDKYEEEL